MIALVDCNNFYCSCERVFNPQLRDKPVVVLSNNDGCIVAHSSEVNAMGIKMRTPLYQIRDILEANNVASFSLMSPVRRYEPLGDKNFLIPLERLKPRIEN